jgi:hypothetical protein
MLLADVFAVLFMNELKNLTDVVIGKEAAHIGYDGFLFLHKYLGEGRGV